MSNGRLANSPALPSLRFDHPSMRLIAGALLILTAEQAFAHAHMANYPNEPRVREVLYPAAGVALLLGLGLMAWGLFSERRTPTGGS